jgi:adenylate cyclase
MRFAKRLLLNACATPVRLQPSVFLQSPSRSVRVARLGSLSVPLVDVPALFVILGDSLGKLHDRGLAADAAAMSTFGAVYFALIVFLASLSLDDRWIWCTAAIATALETLVLRLGGRDITMVILVDLAIVLMAVVCRYASRSTVRLVRAVASEQLRRERLGRYFSPQIATLLAERSLPQGRVAR